MVNSEINKLLWTEIDLDIIAKNMQIIRSLAHSREVAAVIKADAYGHGSVALASTLLENGASRLAVARMDEATELRRNGIKAPIFVLGYTNPQRAYEVITNDIAICIFNYEEACEFSAEAVKLNIPVKFHIGIDTGMNRIGYQPIPEAVAEIVKIAHLPNVIIEGLFTHFCIADSLDKSFTHEQYRRFKYVSTELAQRGLDIPLHHCANSTSIIELPEYHEDMVRAGVILYGLTSSPYIDVARLGLQPAMSFKCTITHIKTIPAGAGVGYGHRYVASTPRVIATIPVGYADGYTRLLAEKARVLIHGQYAKIVGNICMDQCMVDITDIPGVQLGDEVVLFGKQGANTILTDDLAEQLGTINYEIPCMISRRVPKYYFKDGRLQFHISYLRG